MGKIFQENFSGENRDALIFQKEDSKMYVIECYDRTSKHETGPYADYQQAREFAIKWVKE